MGVLFFLKSEQPADTRLEEFKRRIIEYLKSQDTLEKGGMAVGTIREWKGKKYIKGADNKWRRYYNKETRGAKVSIKHLIKKIETINSPEELMKLVLLHRDCFSDDNGNPIPLVQELSKYVSERQDKIAPPPPKKIGKQTGSKKGKKDEWENPLAKYDNIPPRVVAATMARNDNAEKLKDPEKRKLMLNILINGEKWKMSKEDAEEFLDTLANMTDDDRYKARKYADTAAKGEKPKDEATGQIKKKFEEMAVPMEKMEFTRDNYNRLFPEGKVKTPIGDVKLGEHQYEKLDTKDRQVYLGSVYQTLSDPIFIAEIEKNKKKSRLFVKSFIDDEDVQVIVSVVVDIKGVPVSISTHRRDINNAANIIKKGSILYEKGGARTVGTRTFNSSSSEERQPTNTVLPESGEKSSHKPEESDKNDSYEKIRLDLKNKKITWEEAQVRLRKTGKETKEVLDRIDFNKIGENKGYWVSVKENGYGFMGTVGDCFYSIESIPIYKDGSGGGYKIEKYYKNHRTGGTETSDSWRTETQKEAIDLLKEKLDSAVMINDHFNEYDHSGDSEDNKTEPEESEEEKRRNRSEAMKGNKNAYKGGSKPKTKGEIKTAQQEEKKARKKAKIPDDKEPTSALKDSTWNPKSEDYRYKDTGYIAGSRKEKAQEYIRKMAKDGVQVTNTDIDWEGIEENERIAEGIITKQNLMGKPDWETLIKDGLKGNAGYLINELYKTIASKPEKNTAEERQNFSIGLDSIRSRLESCKALLEVVDTAREIYGELTGRFVQSTKTPEYLELAEQEEKIKKKLENFNEKLRDRIFEHGDPYQKAKDFIRSTLGVSGNALFNEYGEWKHGYYTRNSAKQIKLLKEGEQEYNRLKTEAEERMGTTLKTLDNELREVSWKMRETREKKDEELRLTNTIANAWHSMGKSFEDAIALAANQNPYLRKKAFYNHVTKAAHMEEDDYSWADKKAAPTVNKETKKTQFELLVSDRIVRKGGREIKTESTEDLKKAFNLRDVQSGNWVLNDVKSAKFHVENIAMGFADLADITGIPDNLISLNGRLAMAIGARGHNKFLAHYESLERVINITKMKGGGSLAHEWFHAFDNLIAEAMTGGKYNLFLTETNDYEDLTPRQQKCLEQVRRYKRYLDRSPDDSYAKRYYDEAVKKAKKAGVSVDEMESGEDHIQQVKGAFDKLVKAMKTGTATKTKVISYTKDDYEKAKRLFSDGLTVNGQEAREMPLDEVLKKTARTSYMARLGGSARRWIKGDELKKLVVAYHDNKPEGSIVTTNTDQNTSHFFEDSKKLDGGRPKGYWSKTLEMGARAFSAYISDKLNEKGWENTYLTRYATNDDYVAMNARPYPQGEERETINAAFDELFKLIKETGAIRKAIMADFIITLEKSEGNKLEYFRKLILDHLNNHGGEGKELKKSLMQAETAEIKKSGRGLPVGTIRDWKGKKYIKTAPGKWKPKYDSQTRGANMAIAAIERKIVAAKTAKEMLQIVMENKERFTDKDGHPLPFVQDLSKFVRYQSDIAEKRDARKASRKQKNKTEEKIKKLKKIKADEKTGKIDRDTAIEQAAAVYEKYEGLDNGNKEKSHSPKPQKTGSTKWENPLAKYDIKEDIIARSMNEKNAEAARNPKTRATMKVALTERYKISPEDADKFLDHIAGMTKKDFKTASEFAKNIDDRIKKEQGIIDQYIKDYTTGKITPNEAITAMREAGVISVDKAREAFGLKHNSPGAFRDAMKEQLGIDVDKKRPQTSSSREITKDAGGGYWFKNDNKHLGANEKPTYTYWSESEAEEWFKEHPEDRSTVKPSALERLMNDDHEVLEGYVNGNISRTEFRRRLAGKGYNVNEISEIERLSPELKPTNKQPEKQENEKDTKDYTVDTNELYRMAKRQLTKAEASGDPMEYTKQWRSLEDHIFSQFRGMGLSNKEAKKRAEDILMYAEFVRQKNSEIKPPEAQEEEKKVKKAVAEVFAEIFN